MLLLRAIGRPALTAEHRRIRLHMLTFSVGSGKGMGSLEWLSREDAGGGALGS